MSIFSMKLVFSGMFVWVSKSQFTAEAKIVWEKMWEHGFQRFTQVECISGGSLLLKMTVMAIFQGICSEFKNPSSNWQQFPEHGTGQFSNQYTKT